MSITTDRDGLAIVNTKNPHTCNSDASAQKAEAHQLRVRVRKQSGDISRRSASIIRTELQGMDENSLQPKDIYNASLSLYRERRENIPTLPKTRLETMDALEQYDTTNSKKENMLLVNDRDSEIIIISTYTISSICVMKPKTYLWTERLNVVPSIFCRFTQFMAVKMGLISHWFILFCHPKLNSVIVLCGRCCYVVAQRKIVIFDLRLYILTLSALCTMLCQLSFLILALIVADSISVSVGGGKFRPWD
jgi:hypothetical protein